MQPRARSIAAIVLLAVVPALLHAQTPSRSAAAPPAHPTSPPVAGTATATHAPEAEITLQNLELHLLPIAVPLMRGGGAANDVTSVLSNDLHLSALFRVIDPHAFTADLDAEGTGITAPLWSQVGATAVVKANVTGGGDATRAEVFVWEPGRPAAAVYTHTFGPANPRSVAHQIANEIIRHYTGRAGVFGTRILMGRGTGRNRKDVFVMDCDGANLAQISPGRRLNMLPAWGPDGIYYTAQSREGFLGLVRAGRTPTPILQIEGMVTGANFSGGRLAVTLNRDGNPEIYVGNATGGELRRLTNDPAADISPVFSPDGHRIAFVSDRDGSPQVYVMGADGSGQRRVTFTGSYNQTPAWSPDGSTLAYSGRAGGGYDIFTVDVTSGAVRRLTEGQGSNTDPTYSPDGRLIAFSSSRGGIFLMNQDGLAQTRVAAGTAESLRWEH